MAAFEYSALDTEGGSHSGVLQGDTARHVRRQLREQGLFPVDVSEVERGVAAGGFQRGFGAREQALILGQLATLLRAGEPLVDALSALGGADQPRPLRRVLMSVRARVVEGQSLATAMDAFPRHFPDIVRASVAAGERSGRLVQVLDQLAAHALRRERVGRGLWAALLYPVLLALMAVLVVAGLLGYVVPRIVTVFDNFQQELPLATRWLIALSDFVSAWGYWLMLGLLAVLAGLLWLGRNPVRRARWQGWLARLPVLGRLVRASEAARFTRTMAILLASAVPMVQALRVSSRVVTTLPARASIEHAAARVREGVSLGAALRQGGWLPPVVLQLVDSGERSGELAELLERAADIQEQDMDASLNVITGLAQPVLILLVGLMVLFIVLAIMLPILELNTLIGAA